MEQSLADLLSDAFAETSVPSFPDGDLDFENLNFDENSGTCRENLQTKEDVALHPEATSQTAAASNVEVTYLAENVDREESDDKSDEEDFQGEAWTKTQEEDYTSSESESEGPVSGEDDEGEHTAAGEQPGDLLMSVHCGDELSDGDKEDRIFAEGPLAPEGAENPQVRNEEQGESDEEESYFERVPERGSEMMIKGEEDEQRREEERREESCDSESEGMKIEQEENGEGPAKAGVEFPEISVQNLQDLIAEVDDKGCEEKIQDFSGEEHQEAGESFADYPSDFSSCEYVEDGRKNQESASTAKQNAFPERADLTWMRRAADAEEEGDDCLLSRDLEVDAVKFKSWDVAAEEKHRGETETVEQVSTGCDDRADTGESESCSSSDDDIQVKRSDEEPEWLQDRENNRWSKPDSYHTTAQSDFKVNWNLDVFTSDTFLPEDLLTTEGTRQTERQLSDVTQRPAEHANSYSMVKRADAKPSSPSSQGSVDDSFFFNTEASGTSEVGQLGDDEYEEERNWEQEQERIKAFYEFYDDSDGENSREGRQIKVQFCANPLSRVIHFESESSDTDSPNSSTDREDQDDLSSTETSEELKEPDDTKQIKPVCDPPDIQPPENMPDICETPVCTRKLKCLSVLKVILQMGLVIVMGMLMFWLATDQAGWFSPWSFF